MDVVERLADLLDVPPHRVVSALTCAAYRVGSAKAGANLSIQTGIEDVLFHIARDEAMLHFPAPDTTIVLKKNNVTQQVVGPTLVRIIPLLR
jgi:hypothetical protein